MRGQVGDPSWTVKLGRRDSTRAGRQSLAETDLPRANNELTDLISLFSRKGFSAKEMVVLSGSHTTGHAQCVTFRNRIYYNDSSIEAGFARTRRRRCPASGGNSSLAPLGLVTPNSFDNNYFKNLVQRMGLLHSDQSFLNAGSTDGFVTEYSINRNAFNSNFAAAMVKMADMDPLPRTAGEIRLDCKVLN